MSCQAELREKRATLLSRWRDRIFESYPSEAARFFRDERDPFKNPVGHSIHHATEVLFDAIVLDQPQAGVADALEGMVRVRAVQDLSPSQAVAFVFQLKQALREGLALDGPGSTERKGLGPLEDRLDSLAAMAFDCYVSCVKSIHTIRLNELKRRTAVLTARFGGFAPDAGPAAMSTDDPKTTKGGSQS